MPRRYLRQRLPWIAIEPSDLLPQGDPETVVFLQKQGAIVGLAIRGLDGHVMLGIREDAQGHPLSCAVTNEVEIDTNCQSNPRRQLDAEDQA